MPQYKFIIEDESDGERLDKLLSELMPDCSRTFIQKLIKDGAVTKNGAVVTKSSQRPEAGDELLLSIPEPVVPEIIPEDIPIDIVYEDSDILIVNKQKGMVVHPAPGHLSGTLVNAILYHCKDLSGINGILRPGIVHRIDKDTSGLLIICKNDNSHKNIAAQLKDHSIERTYHAIVHGRFNEEFGTVDANIGRSSNDRKKMAVVDRLSGKTAVTHYTVLKEFSGYSYIKCNLETGRTHQIRVHMAHIHHPIYGDEVYGHAVKGLTGQCLHAKVLGFIHPSTGAYMEFEAPIPDYFQKLIEARR